MLSAEVEGCVFSEEIHMYTHVTWNDGHSEVTTVMSSMAF